MRRLTQKGAAALVMVRFAKSRSDEDKEELERERLLREQFARKINSSSQHETSQSSGIKTDPASIPSEHPSKVAIPFFRRPVGKFVFFGFCLYALIVISQLDDPSSTINLVQGIPWWQLPVDSVAYYVIFRQLLPYRRQREILQEYQTEQLTDSTLSFAQFCQRRYPALFHGYRVSQPEIIAALCAVSAANMDIGFVGTVRRHGKSSDIKSSVDAIMDGLRVDYPLVFSAR